MRSFGKITDSPKMLFDTFGRTQVRDARVYRMTEPVDTKFSYKIHIKGSIRILKKI